MNMSETIQRVEGSEHHGLETIMNLLLLRFGVIAIVVVVVAIVVFALALTLHRRGKLHAVVQRVAPVARKTLDARNDRDGGRGSRGLGSIAARAASDYLGEHGARPERSEEMPPASKRGGGA